MYYKTTEIDGRGVYAGGFRWPLPANGQPGAWTPKVSGLLRECENGYHLCTRGTLLDWLAPAIHVVESQSPVIVVGNKHITAGPCRIIKTFTAWDARSSRLFAADCADSVLYLFERAYPGDYRPRAAIDATIAFAFDLIGEGDLLAAREAAAGAARGTVEAAAREAAAWAAEVAAWAAAGAARGAAARVAAMGAGEHQINHLFALLEEVE